MTPDSFGAFQKNEAQKWAKIIRDSGLKPE
jgi:hypothetical protein